MDKSASRSVSHGRMLYHYDIMMDNSCKIVDGRMYKKLPRIADDDILADDLKEGDIDYTLLIWSDFADSRSNDHVVLKNRNI